ncbi:Conserved oligomeric Golgi complex subunit 4 [Frankliniella fusca]|uniref:Conserved oligomeric Golgi complex subunit 4 n=1 Tax=Frankliniella fusca TaxID=407009 RepID=A0AAE1HTG3_9NEOP|nr:Conserved oligomeric Golgi complex subunit 4 [Frankliniella fusca]
MVSIKLNPQELSDSAGIQKVCEKIAAEEENVTKQLENLLSRQCHLEAKLRSVTKALPNLQIVKSDAQHLSEMIAHTSNLAENVSAKVRKLDDARSRVSECQQRVHDLLDLQLCSEGVKLALQEEDYEKGAAHVHRFLSMDQTLLRQTADDVQQDCTAVTNSFSLLHKAAELLQIEVTARFDEAVRADDLASVERFFKIFPLLGLQDQGLNKFSVFLCSKLQETAQKNLKAALETRTADKRASVIYADTLTLLFEGIARIIEIHQPLIESYYGPGRLLTVVNALQEECDRQSKLILNEFRKHRQLDSALSQVAEWLRSSSSSTSSTNLSSATASQQSRTDPKNLDLLLGELTIMHARAEMYVRFIRRRVQNDVEVGVSAEATRGLLMDKLETMLRGSGLCHSMQALLGNYLQLEHYFMAESVRKAVALDQLEENLQIQQTSSMVDDVFFIVRKCMRRAISSSSLDGVCAVLNNACSLLEADYCSVLRAQLRHGYMSGYLDLTQAYNALQSSLQQGRLQASDSEKARLTFLAYLNNADVSTEYIATLRLSLGDEMAAALPGMTERDRAKLESCLSGLGGVTASLRALVEYGMSQLSASAIKPRVSPWVETFLNVSHILTEEEFSSYEANEPFVRNLVANLESLLSSFKSSLTPTNYDTLVSILATEVTHQMEKVIAKSSFNRLGGLVLDKEVRVLVVYLTNATSWSIRDKFARLTQIATVLNLERVSEISDYWSNEPGAIAWRLTPAEVRHFMTLRTDFRSEDIKRIKL